MRIGFVSKGSVHDYKETYASEGEELLLFGFEGMGEVRYERELKGESNFFEEGALLSKRDKNLLVSGCITNGRGLRRKSALVAENGKILGISDSLYAVDGAYKSGAELKIYQTKLGKMGVLVGEDLYFPEAAQALSLCGCDFIVCPFEKVEGELPSVLLRANAFLFGAPILLCGSGYAMAASPSGEVAFASPASPAQTSVELRKEYHLVERRVRAKFS